jgi:hypothetical protein
MKKIILMIAAIILVAGLTTTVKSQSNKATANALASIVSAISLAKDVDLNFGSMTPPTADVDVVLSTTNSITTDVAKILHFPTGTANAHYNVSGEKNYAYTITLPLTPITITKSGANPMNVENFQARTLSGSSNGLSGTLDGSGQDSFAVGATLKVTNAQPIGAYTGSFEVMVVY